MGHFTEQAGVIHAVCLPCIEKERETRLQEGTLQNPSMLKECALCRSPFIDGTDPDTQVNQDRVRRGEPPIVRRKVFTVHPEPITEQGSFIGRVIEVVNMPSVRPTLPVENVARVRADLPRRINNVRGRSTIEIVFETIGRELVGRVVSLVVGVVGGAAVGMIAGSSIAMGVHLIDPDAPVFEDGPGGLNLGVALRTAGVIWGGLIGGVICTIENPFGGVMGSIGALTGRGIVIGLDGVNDLIERTNRAWANVFVNVAEQPV